MLQMAAHVLPVPHHSAGGSTLWLQASQVTSAPYVQGNPPAPLQLSAPPTGMFQPGTRGQGGSAQGVSSQGGGAQGESQLALSIGLAVAALVVVGALAAIAALAVRRKRRQQQAAAGKGLSGALVRDNSAYRSLADVAAALDGASPQRHNSSRRGTASGSHDARSKQQRPPLQPHSHAARLAADLKAAAPEPAPELRVSASHTIMGSADSALSTTSLPMTVSASDPRQKLSTALSNMAAQGAAQLFAGRWTLESEQIQGGQAVVQFAREGNRMLAIKCALGRSLHVRCACAGSCTTLLLQVSQTGTQPGGTFAHVHAQSPHVNASSCVQGVPRSQGLLGGAGAVQ